MKILFLTTWFPNQYELTKCVFTKNMLDALVQHTTHDYAVICPIPYFPKVTISCIPTKYLNYARLPYIENSQPYSIYRPRFVKLPHPFCRNLEWYPYYRAALRVIRNKNLKFDLIHSHGLYPDGYAATKIGRQFGVPVVTHAHDSHFGKIYLQYKRQIDQIMRRTQRVIAVSNFQKNAILSVYKHLAEKVVTIYNGVDPSRFSCEEEDGLTCKEPLRLVFVGNLVSTKGLDILLRSVKSLADNLKITLDIYGDGPEKNTYLKMTDGLGISDVVHFKGVIENDKLAHQLRKHDFLLLPSRTETFGIVAIEALSCGVPVIATAVGAIPEIVVSDEVGILVRPESHEALADGINKAREKEWNARKISAHVTHNFSIETTAKRIETIYEEILATERKAE